MIVQNNPQTTEDYMAGYKAAYQGDISALSRTLSSQCRRFMEPSSFAAAAGISVDGLTNDEYKSQMKSETALAEDIKFDAKQNVVDEWQKISVVWMDFVMILKGGQRSLVLFMWILTMNGNGDKMDKVVTFVDTTACLALMEYMKEIAHQGSQKA